MIGFALAIGVAYGLGMRSLARRNRQWPVLRWCSAAGGVLALGASGVVPDRSMNGHMIEHLLIGMIAPLLLALSAPITLALQTTPPWFRQPLRTALHSKPAVWLSNPIVGLAVFGTSLVVLYLTPLLEWSASNVVVHVIVHAHLLAAGALFMWPIIAIDPIPRRIPFGARMLTVFAAVPFHAFLGLAIISTTTLLAPQAYPSLDDQHRAGGLLWISGELMSLALAAIVGRAWYESDRRAGERDRRSIFQP
ncbi:MAG: cytochrome c oxidase assembly protein [Ilumatobacteraceae bacterium]